MYGVVSLFANRNSMTHTRTLVCLIFGLILLAACNKDKAPQTGTADNTATAPPVAATPPVAEVPPPPKPVVIPGGTMLTVRLKNAVGSKTSQQGVRFEASLVGPITGGEKTAAASGSGILGTVTE